MRRLVEVLVRREDQEEDSLIGKVRERLRKTIDETTKRLTF